MSDGATLSAHGPASDDPQLDRWIEKAAGHPVHLPALWRALKTAELHVIVPCDPGDSGEFEIERGEALTVVTLEDRDGRYAPVFTRFEDAEGTCAGLGDDYGIASLEALVLFEILANMGHRVVINPFSHPRISITPATVRELACGHFSAHRQAAEPDVLHLISIPSGEVPHALLLAARGFCARRRLLIGLHLFHPVDPVTLEPNFREYRFLLRMHERDDEFCKDFKKAVTSAAPPSQYVSCIPVLDTHTDTAALLESHRPLWPV